MEDRDIQVSCTVHGLMHWRIDKWEWDCEGFDGEGCTVNLTFDEAFAISLGRPIQRVTNGELGSWTSDWMTPNTLKVSIAPEGATSISAKE